MYSVRGMGDITTMIPTIVGAGMEASTPSVDAGFPGYCDWLPLAEHLTACQVPTAAVQNAAIQQQIVKASGGDTATADKEYQAYLDDTAALAKLDPEGRAQYEFSAGNPHLAAILGADPFGRIVGGAANVGAGVSAWLGIPVWVWLIGGLGAFVMVSGGGSPRRYGR